MRARKNLMLLVAAVLALAGSGAIASATLNESRNEPRAGLAAADARQGLSARSAPPSAENNRRACKVDAKLVPTCGLLWGVAPGAFTGLSSGRALSNFESTTGRPADILHSY